MSRRATDRERDIARALADEVINHGGRLTLSLEDLLTAFEIKRFTGASRVRLDDAIDRAGLTAEPPIRGAQRGSSVTLRASARRRVPAARQPSRGTTRPLHQRHPAPGTRTGAELLSSPPPRTTKSPDASSAAAELRGEVERLGGRMTIAVSTLMALFAVDELSAETSRRIEDALSDRGISAAPSLSRAVLSGQIELSVASHAPRDLGQNTGESIAPQPSSAGPAGVVASRAAALPEAVLGAGVLVPGLLATVAGFAAWWGFGLLFLALTGGAWWSVGRIRFGLARVFLFPFRSLRLAAFTVALVPMLLAVLLLSAVVVAPVSAERASDARERDAHALVAQAAREVDRGDLDRAERLLAAAQDRHRDAAGYAEVRRRASDESQRRADDREHALAYDDARDDYSRGNYAAAVSTLRDLGDYRDSSRLADEFERDGSRALRARARTALEGRRYDSAIALAQESRQLRESPFARELVRHARTEQAAARARARARARALAQARREAARERG